MSTWWDDDRKKIRYGRGMPYRGGVEFWYTAGCPLHARPETAPRRETDREV